jgi:fibrillarin-like rRNA methylase
MFQIFRHGVDISRHHLKGVYVCMIGKKRNQCSQSPESVICSLREGRSEDSEEVEVDREKQGGNSKPSYGPITLSYQGAHVTLRPWDPYNCVIGAGIHNRLIHFPFRPGTRVFALNSTLQTLSHIADIVGGNGRVIGVIDESYPQRPSQADLSKFLKRHPGVSVIMADVQNASLETYERLLSIPDSSRYAFLMATHPRLGENSPARVLKDAPQKVFKLIFDFLECTDAAKVKCLLGCLWQPARG